MTTYFFQKCVSFRNNIRSFSYAFYYEFFLVDIKITVYTSETDWFYFSEENLFFSSHRISTYLIIGTVILKYMPQNYDCKFYFSLNFFPTLWVNGFLKIWCEFEGRFFKNFGWTKRLNSEWQTWYTTGNEWSLMWEDRKDGRAAGSCLWPSRRPRICLSPSQFSTRVGPNSIAFFQRCIVYTPGPRNVFPRLFCPKIFIHAIYGPRYS